jgi:DNA-binding transcriptional regulator WhiA
MTDRIERTKMVTDEDDFLTVDECLRLECLKAAVQVRRDHSDWSLWELADMMLEYVVTGKVVPGGEEP